MGSLKFKYNTEAAILALTPSSPEWVERAFYYPEDKTYFYQALNGEMKLYGGGDVNVVGVGVTLNGKVIGGVKSLIEENETLIIPDNYEYNVFKTTIDGTIILDGTLNQL